MFSGFFWSSQEKTQTLFDACDEFKSVNAILLKLREKQKALKAEGDAIKSSDAFQLQQRINIYKKEMGMPVDDADPLASRKVEIISNLLGELDQQIEKFNKEEMNVSGLTTVLNAKLCNIDQFDLNVLNTQRNNNAAYAYYASRTAVAAAGAAVGVATSPSVLIAIPSSIFGAYVASKADDKIREKYEDDSFETASAQLVSDLKKSVSAVLDKLTNTPKGP